MFKRIILSMAAFLIFPLLAQASNTWDGRYNSVFEFKMSPQSVCPRFLPIEIELTVKDGKVSGFIFNNGGGNSHNFCKLYHNGEIYGEIASDGELKNVYIRQSDPHSIQYSSYLL